MEISPRLQLKGEPSACSLALQDSLFLTLVALLSLILSLRGLGFYSDDWLIMELFTDSSDQSFFGLFRAVYFDHTRPVQFLYLTGIYWLFGAHALAYHLVNALAFTAAILLFYTTLREVGLPRLLTLVPPLVYALLPHYSTDRFWIAAMAANLSMALYFLSFYASLRSLQAQTARAWLWGVLSILGLLCSILAYEVAVPLFFFNLLLIWCLAPERYELFPSKKSGRLKLLVISNLLALIALIVFKVMTSGKIGFKGDLTTHIARLVKGIIYLFYGKEAYGLGLPRTMYRILRYYPDRLVFVLGVGVGLLILAYLYYITGRMKGSLPGRATWLKLVGFGVVVLILGYAIFLTNSQVQFSNTGIVNRTAFVASLGMAMQLVGGLGWLSTFLPSNLLRRIAFCIMVAVLCTSGFIINNTIAGFWTEAGRQQAEILTDIHNHLPTLPVGGALILDGICPYVGPGIVFEAHFDLGPALMMSYKDHSLRGDVVTPRLSIGEEGLSTYIYGTNSKGYDPNNRKTFLSHCCPIYPYNEKLFLYNFRQKKIYQLTDMETARRYFQTFNPTQNSACRGEEGLGSWVF